MRLIRFFVFLGASVALALWMMIAGIWPANKLIELQAGWFNGEYYPKLTFAVVWLFVLIIFALIASSFSWLLDKLKTTK